MDACDATVAHWRLRRTAQLRRNENKNNLSCRWHSPEPLSSLSSIRLSSPLLFLHLLLLFPPLRVGDLLMISFQFLVSL